MKDLIMSQQKSLPSDRASTVQSDTDTAANKKTGMLINVNLEIKCEIYKHIL